MTVFNFPDTAGKPTDGTFTWTAPNGLLYSWDGDAWRTIGGGGDGNASITITDDLSTIPAPDAGDLAWHTIEARMYIYYQDDDSQQWVDASPAGDSDSYWERNGTTLEPVTAGDDVDLGTGDLSAANGTFNNGLTTYFPGVGGTVIQEWRSNYPSANHVKARLYANGGFSIGGAGAGLSTPVFSIGGLDGSVNIGGDIAGGSPNITLNAGGLIQCAGTASGFQVEVGTQLAGSIAGFYAFNNKPIRIASSPTFAAPAVGMELSVGGNSWGTFSQRSLKTDLTPITDGLNKVSSLECFTGRYKTDEPGTSRSFLIAEDVQKVLPEAVWGEGTEEHPLTLGYTAVIPLLVSALHDAKARIEALEAKVQQLQGGN